MIGMQLDLIPGGNGDLFKVENAITRIEQSKEPDIEKVKILYEDMGRIFKDLRLDKRDKISALSYDKNTHTNTVKEMTEKELISQIHQAETTRYDMKANELVKVNALNLATHYKYYYQNIAPIVRCLEFTQTLLNRVLTTVKLADDYKLKEEIGRLREELFDKDKEVGLMQTELQKKIERLEQAKSEMTGLLFNERMFKMMAKIYMQKITDPDTIKLIFFIYLEGPSTIKEMYKKIMVSPKIVNNIIAGNPQIFKVDAETMIVELNLAPAQDAVKYADVAQEIEKIEQRPLSEEIKRKGKDSYELLKKSLEIGAWKPKKEKKKADGPEILE